jgi:hypothetical protein
VKRKVTEDVYVTVPQRLNDKAKAKLPEFQSPAVELHILPCGKQATVARLYTDAIGSHEFSFCLWYALADRR